jgi:hypothetical protein
MPDSMSFYTIPAYQDFFFENFLKIASQPVANRVYTTPTSTQEAGVGQASDIGSTNVIASQ